MCNYTYHHDPNCGHIVSFNIDTCTAFTSSLRLTESESDQQPISCINTVYSHDLIHPSKPSLCLQCEREWMERAKKRVKAIGTANGYYKENGNALMEVEEKPSFLPLEGLDYPPKVRMTFTFTTPKGKKEKLIGLGITMDGGVQSDADSDVDSDLFYSEVDNGYGSDYEDANEHGADEDGESCRTNSPFASPSSSFFENQQFFDFDAEDTTTPYEYLYASAIDDDSTDEDIELVYLDYPKATSELEKYLHDLDSDSGSDSIEFFDLSPASSHLGRSFLDLEDSNEDDEESISLVSGTPRSPRTKEFKELEEIISSAVPSVTQFLAKAYNGLPILSNVVEMR